MIIIKSINKKIAALLLSVCAFCALMLFNGQINWRYRLGIFFRGTDAVSDNAVVMPDISVGYPEKDKFDSIIIEAAQKYDLDPFLIKAIIEIESRFNHRAISSKGAKGLMQLMPSIAKLLDVEDTFDARANIYGGALHLRGLLNRYNSIEKALGFYYAGNRYRRRPEVGYTYIRKVLTKYNHFKNMNGYICGMSAGDRT